MRKGDGHRRSAGETRPRERKKVLFFCACNAIRSQMAEGILRTRYGDRYEVFSAGIKPTRLSPVATRVMSEIGIDISDHSSKSIELFVGTKFDCVAMVCGDPKGVCPFLPVSGQEFACAGCSGCCTLHPFFPAGKQLLHVRFHDLIEQSGDEHIDQYRKIRDELKEWIEETFGRQDSP